MKLTNKFNLPQTFINVIHRPTYSKGDSHISATELLNSPRIVQLKHKHWDEIEQDASEMVWQLFGSAVHKVLEHGKDDHHVIEERLFTEFEGWKISGAIDLQEVHPEGICIRDYKVTGAWSVMNEKSDWHNQLNVYAWLIERVKQQPVKDLAIIAIIRDWSAREAQTKENYPDSPIATINIPLWSFEEREAYVKRRLSQHNDAYFAFNTDTELPECTTDDMWEKPTTYAVKKEGGVRAKSVHPTREEAEAALTKGYFIEVRNGERTRCKSYCQVSQFCSQYQTYLKDQS
jgi:hypothetical protein